MSDAAWVAFFNNLPAILASLALLLGPSALGAILTARQLGEVAKKTDEGVALTVAGNAAIAQGNAAIATVGVQAVGIYGAVNGKMAMLVDKAISVARLEAESFAEAKTNRLEARIARLEAEAVLLASVTESDKAAQAARTEQAVRDVQAGQAVRDASATKTEPTA